MMAPCCVQMHHQHAAAVEVLQAKLRMHKIEHEKELAAASAELCERSFKCLRLSVKQSMA